MLVEGSDALFARALDDGAPPPLQGAFEKAWQHVIEDPTLHPVERALVRAYGSKGVELRFLPIGAKTVEVSSSHASEVSHPRELASLILAAAGVGAFA